jgi:hopanoid biosynthesis associated protein HpnK
MKLSFVYPVYNEAANLPRLLPETARIAEGLFPDYEVVLADDGSSDGSGRLMDLLAADSPRVRVVHHQHNRGLGAAIRTGLATATGDVVLYMDSDFPVAAEEARAALRQWRPDADMLIGYRLGRAEGPRREIMSWSYNRLIRWGFGVRVRDVNFAFKLIRRPLLDRMRLRSEGSFIDAEILLEAKRLGARLQELGLHYHPRVAGVSTAASGRVVLGILSEASRYWRARRQKADRVPSLVVNADDLGLCEAVNLGVAEAFDHGVVTSASLMPTGEAFAHAVDLAKARPGLDLGVHLALTQTRPILGAAAVPSLANSDGDFLPTWRAFLARYLRGQASRQDIESELRAQIEHLRQAGLQPSHLDSHQHLHLLPGVLPIVLRLARECGITALRWPHQRFWTAKGNARRAEGLALSTLCRLGARAARANGLLVADDFRGFAEAGTWDARGLARAVSAIGPGLTEICCHPALDDSVADRFPWGYRWRQELDALTSPEVAAAVKASGVKLTAFRSYLSDLRLRAGRA